MAGSKDFWHDWKANQSKTISHTVMLQMLVEADMPGDHDFGYGLADSATTMRL